MIPQIYQLVSVGGTDKKVVSQTQVLDIFFELGKCLTFFKLDWQRPPNPMACLQI